MILESKSHMLYVHMEFMTAEFYSIIDFELKQGYRKLADFKCRGKVAEK